MFYDSFTFYPVRRCVTQAGEQCYLGESSRWVIVQLHHDLVPLSDANLKM